MLLAASEGRHWRYEVCEHSDGYLVQMRDLETGDLHEEFATIVRPLPGRLPYAAMSAGLAHEAAAEIEGVEDEEIAFELDLSERNFIALSDRLHDTGLNG